MALTQEEEDAEDEVAVEAELSHDFDEPGVIAEAEAAEKAGESPEVIDLGSQEDDQLEEPPAMDEPFAESQAPEPEPLDGAELSDEPPAGPSTDLVGDADSQDLQGQIKELQDNLARMKKLRTAKNLD